MADGLIFSLFKVLNNDRSWPHKLTRPNIPSPKKTLLQSGTIARWFDKVGCVCSSLQAHIHFVMIQSLMKPKGKSPPFLSVATLVYLLHTGGCEPVYIRERH